ncbi:hypothetical protein DICPUDRAFT_76006 [Dictyostelium purpureum]|uniref:Uncharacterized protein n=1 Tax=Dictyostelium purpureum TaxID=5786 RepID=F0ZCA8_DICPU|nr:uncharacterized protein DICPUDRAFT_76006 [Dictyostelium purpureum]EGC38388.1 hypothetical protein DICPUDRAFT_76006 [Dictyostelium purpureum]|eukprot:XP_003285049.1 hypothetical protein DICPUDRAFT_76006 [Dictyostelium purpureum]
MNNKIIINLLILILCICSLPYSKSLITPTTKANDDWSVPEWVSVSSNSGFFSEEATSSLNINVPVFDVAWKQVNPSKGVYQFDSTATVKGMNFASFNNQNSTKNAFWMRIWNSGVDWAPSWIKSYCGVDGVATDYDGDKHLPIWNSCVWGEIKAMYKTIFKDNNMRADKRLKFIYVPGAFNWCEFDFTEISEYKGTNISFTYNVFNTWFQTAMQDLVDIFGEYSYKLVYTGEDYPFDVDDWPASRNLLAKDAVSKGMGIRNGITELFNFHLNQIPAYGITIDTATGYLNFDKSWPLQANPNRVIGTENECYNSCGFNVPNSNNLYYAVKMSNLKALQMGVNWLYLVATDSYLSQYPELYNWIRYSLGKQASTSFDAWAVLRKAQDKFWIYDDSLTWPDKPFIKNLERFLTQRDLSGGAQTKESPTKKTGIYNNEGADLGDAYEGRQTNLATGNTAISFFLDDDFASGNCTNIQIKVTYLDLQASQFLIKYQDGASVLNTSSVTVGTTQSYITATFNFSSITFSNSVSGTRKADFEIINSGSKDIEVLFIRVIKLNQNSSSSNNNNNNNNSNGNSSGNNNNNSNSGTSSSESKDQPNNGSRLTISFSLFLILFITFILH